MKGMNLSYELFCCRVLTTRFDHASTSVESAWSGKYSYRLCASQSPELEHCKSINLNAEARGEKHQRLASKMMQSKKRQRECRGQGASG